MAFYFGAPVDTIVLILYLGLIIYDIIHGKNTEKWPMHLIYFFLGVGLQVPLIFMIPEYYIFEEDRIIVRSLRKIKKEVKIEKIKSIYWQDLTQKLSLRKLYYYVIDDGSSDTLQYHEYRCSSNLDLMRIPIDKKSKAIITSIWPHEIQESHFPERK